MIPTGKLYIGRVIRRYDHGYIVIWDDDKEIGLESTDEHYERIDDLCPSPSHLLGSLAVYQSDSNGRTATWFTAFSDEQLRLLIGRISGDRTVSVSTSELLAAINGALSAARRTQGGDVKIYEYELIGEKNFTRVWNAHADAIEQAINENLP